MPVLSLAWSALGVFAIATGLGDLLLGPHLLVAAGADLGRAVGDPWLDSQLRFLGTMWAGWGALMFWCCRDLHDRGRMFDFLNAVLFLAGCGRAGSLLLHPDSPPLIAGFTAIELLLPPLGISLHRRQRSGRSAAGAGARPAP